MVEMILHKAVKYADAVIFATAIAIAVAICDAVINLSTIAIALNLVKSLRVGRLNKLELVVGMSEFGRARGGILLRRECPKTFAFSLSYSLSVNLGSFW